MSSTAMLEQEFQSLVLQRLDSIEERFDARLEKVETRLDHFETNLDKFNDRFANCQQAIQWVV